MASPLRKDQLDGYTPFIACLRLHSVWETNFFFPRIFSQKRRTWVCSDIWQCYMSCKKLHEFVHSYVCLLIFLSFIAFICLTRLCGLRPMDPSACRGTLLQTDRRQPLNFPFRSLFVCIVFSYTDTDTFLKFLGYITIQSNPLTAPRCYLRPRHVIN